MNGSFDQKLRRELARVAPPAGFADRVMANLPEGRGRGRFWLGAVAAGLAVLFTVGGIEQNHREHRMQAERTQRQVVFALFLAAEKLDHVNARLQRSAPDLTIEGDERGRL
ncbi:MAG: hypothetical protein JWP08_4188 [Bryobacterales bacterium]|jgi:hypothetical protein|nr:hypothetical protein [Bryobacterales bacterium]